MLTELVRQVANDCAQHGYGRKRWWADKLQVPPLTLSHWLAGRQNPDGGHALAIKSYFDAKENDRRAEKSRLILWQSYYGHEKIPSFLLPNFILDALSKTSLDSRTLALLSVFVEHTDCPFEEPEGKLKNRLGWLLEVSGRRAPFKPQKSSPRQDILESGLHSPRLKKYLRGFQTQWGKKWSISDCPLDEMKESLPWKRN
ncbi:MAG: hypothetical protein Q7T11_05855 [Deltaproteobacteria bacterium]|nr:hypothetical protein [Deltaproteobacteria bacterium]